MPRHITGHVANNPPQAHSPSLPKTLLRLLPPKPRNSSTMTTKLMKSSSPPLSNGPPRPTKDCTRPSTLNAPAGTAKPSANPTHPASPAFSNQTATSKLISTAYTGPQPTPVTHIQPLTSAHNAIKPTAPRSTTDANIKAIELERNYNKSRRQALKKGREPPARSEYMMYYGYGYPMYMPYYAPYMGDPGVTQANYAGNPACANFTPGAVGNCCAGACGGGVAAGACGGMGGGGCGGGVAGGCGGGGGGSGSGGCGGGGGGGGGCGGGGGGS